MGKNRPEAYSDDNNQPDKRALTILSNLYWSSQGWIRDTERALTLEDFEYAKSKGLMFDPLSISHSEVMSRLLSALRKTGQQFVANAFIASLSTRRLDWRSALGSFAVFRNLRDHTPVSRDGLVCDSCGLYLKPGIEDLNVLNFERFKWGGVRHYFPTYAMLDLELLAKSDPPEPGSIDIQIFREIIHTIEGLPSGVTAAALQGKLGTIFKSNKAERDTLVGILGYCGVLSKPGLPDFAQHFVSPAQRELPDHHYVDMPYPACWWRSEYGIDSARLKEYFGHIL
jgi:hypothetical protein